MKDRISVLLGNCRLGFIVFSLFGIAAASVGAAQTSISACPYNITAPGNYVVARNLAASGTCINFATPVSNVSIDLQGHSILGNGTGYGIVCIPSDLGNLASGCNHVVLANGTIKGFAGGIFLGGNSNTVTQIDSQQNMGVENGTNPGYGSGIFLAGQSGNIITSSSATGNAGIGIACGGNAFSTPVTDSQSDNNGSHGIACSGSVSNSTAENNGNYGIVAETIISSTVQKNVSGGISAAGITIDLFGNINPFNSDTQILVVNSTASGNSGDGIRSTGNVIGSTAQNNGGQGIVLFCPVSAAGDKAINNPGGNIVLSDATCLLLDIKTAP
jgi:hypothetical protein